MRISSLVRGLTSFCCACERVAALDGNIWCNGCKGGVSTLNLCGLFCGKWDCPMNGRDEAL